MLDSSLTKKVFFADELKEFVDLDNTLKTVLKNVHHYEDDCFVTFATGYKYFLPCEWVDMGEPEKKWRPFSLTEWRYNHSIGDKIIFRIKNSDTARVYMFCGLISDHDDNLPGKGVINLGGELFVLQNLFDNFELCKDDEWRPFGMEKED